MARTFAALFLLLLSGCPAYQSSSPVGELCRQGNVNACVAAEQLNFQRQQRFYRALERLNDIQPRTSVFLPPPAPPTTCVTTPTNYGVATNCW